MLKKIYVARYHGFCMGVNRAINIAENTAAKAKNRDFTVDWVHLKLNDQTQRTVLCKDPFRAVDERVEKLIESL